MAAAADIFRKKEEHFVEIVKALTTSSVPFAFFALAITGKTVATYAVSLLNVKRVVALLAIVSVDVFIFLLYFAYAILSGKLNQIKKVAATVEDPSGATRHRSGAVYAKNQSSSEESPAVRQSVAPMFVAGTTLTRCEGDGVPKPGVDSMMWQDAVASKFKLRIGPNYKKTSAKAPSETSLYELVGMDLFRCTKDRLRNIGNRPDILLPAVRATIDPSVEDLQKSGIPRLFIVNAQIPEKPPLLMGKNKDDAGYSLVFYFAAKSSTVAQFLSGTPTPAAELLHKYIHQHSTNPDIRRRFKAIGMADIKDVGIPGVGSLIDSFNGKPAIINKVADIYSSGDNMDWFEVDISIFDFPFLAQKGLSAMKDKVSQIGIRAGFTFQGETDEELPEVLLGGAECVIDFSKARPM